MKNQLFEEIAKEYSLQILKWAYKKSGDRHRAEELAQEVMLQIFSSIQKNWEEGRSIEQMEHFIWKIAHYVWCHSLRKNASYAMYPIEEILDESDFVSELAENEEQMLLLAQMRKQISRLNYLQREILISFYIDELPQKTIANRLGISESAVKWHLHDTRRKLKKEMAENMEKQRQQEFFYRPRKLSMALSGQVVAQSDTRLLEESLVKQNICISCYNQPKSLDDLTEQLGIPKAYLEFDLYWLVEHEFLECINGKYATAFYIQSRSEKQEEYAVYCKLQAQVSDVITNGLMQAEECIRKIGFHGSNLPMNKLLWLLIYTFCNDYQEKTPDFCIEEPIRPDGGKYFPLGFIEDTEEITEWVLDNRGFSYNGAQHSNSISWFGLYNFGNSVIENLMGKFTPEGKKLHDLLVEIIKENFDISQITEEQKYDLAKLVEQGFVKVQYTKAIPQFVIFTTEQYEQLKREVFQPIAQKLQPGYEMLTQELTKFYHEKLPKQLKAISKLPLRQALYDMAYVTTLIAFRTGILYVPKDSADGEFLTMMYKDSNT